jgi:hypothetical protein
MVGMRLKNSERPPKHDRTATERPQPLPFACPCPSISAPPWSASGCVSAVTRRDYSLLVLT